MHKQNEMYDWIKGMINEARNEDNRRSRATKNLVFGGRQNQVILYSIDKGGPEDVSIPSIPEPGR